VGAGCVVIELEEVESDVVAKFVDFVYTGAVSMFPDIEQLFALGKLADRCVAVCCVAVGCSWCCCDVA